MYLEVPKNQLNELDWCVGFHNLPKTGGTSINYFVNKYLEEGVSYNIGPHSAVSNFFIRRNQYLGLSKEEISKLRFIQSHHLNFRSLDFFNKYFLLITVLRDPIDMEVSAYFYNRSRLLALGLKPKTPEEFFSIRPKNFQVHQILNSWPELITTDSPNLVDRAVSILEKFQEVFILPTLSERFVSFSESIFGVTGGMQKRRVNKKKDSKLIDMDLISNRVELDQELYGVFSSKSVVSQNYMKLLTPRKSDEVVSDDNDTVYIDHYKKMAMLIERSRQSVQALVQIELDIKYCQSELRYINAQLLKENILSLWEKNMRKMSLQERW